MTDESPEKPAEATASDNDPAPAPGAGAPPPPPAGAAPPPPPSGTPAGGGHPPGGSTPGGSTPGGTPSSNRTVFLILAYLGPLALIPFLIEKDDSEVQWHSKHGLVIFLAEIILGVLIGVGNMIAGTVIPFIGCITCIVPVVLSIGLLIFHVMCIMKALEGQRLLVPGVSEYADRF